MIVFHYTDIDNLERILSATGRGNQHLVLRAKHRCFLNDDAQRTFGNYLLPSCIESIENELGVDTQMAVSPLIKQKGYIKNILDSINTFDDHCQRMNSFVLSFSEDQDNADLWRNNAHRACGLALGFDTDRIQLDRNRFVNVFRNKCTYWSDEIKSPEFCLPADSKLYASIREAYKMITNPKVIESFNIVYSQDGPAEWILRRIKDTLVSNIITTFDVFHKQDIWRNENEYRVMLSPIPTDIQFVKDDNGDYVPFANVTIPVDALRMIMIGQKCGNNAYGMVKSMLMQKGVSQDVKILNSVVPGVF